MSQASPYRALVQFASELRLVDRIDDIEEMCDDAAVDFVETNSNLLRCTRGLLGPSCSTSLRYDKEFYSEHLDDIFHIRNLAQAFYAEATVAVAGEDFPNAVDSGLAILDLANASRRGGLITSMLVGVAIEGIGFSVLRKLRTDLPVDCMRKLAEGLEGYERERESFAAISTRDAEWEKIAFQNETSDVEIAVEALYGDETSSEEEREIMSLVREVAESPREVKEVFYATNDLRMIAMSRLLRVDLAIRDYLNEHTSFPDSLSDLTSIVDPFTERPFVYRRIGNDSFVLYSPGPTKIDHGGRFSGWPWVAAGEADYCIDAPDYWPRSKLSVTEALAGIVTTPVSALVRWLRRS